MFTCPIYACAPVSGVTTPALTDKDSLSHVDFFKRLIIFFGLLKKVWNTTESNYTLGWSLKAKIFGERWVKIWLNLNTYMYFLKRINSYELLHRYMCLFLKKKKTASISLKESSFLFLWSTFKSVGSLLLLF